LVWGYSATVSITRPLRRSDLSEIDRLDGGLGESGPFVEEDPMARTPWIGLAALIAMFAIPFLPSWLFEGPRRVRHWPQQHVCGACGVPWTDGHLCAPAMAAVSAPAPQVGEVTASEAPLRGEIRRVKAPKAALSRRGRAELERAPRERLAG
jgi:hypothetical protein